MTDEQIKTNIKETLQAFAKGNLTEKSIELFENLGYVTERRAPLNKPTYTEFKDTYIGDKKFDEAKAKTNEWKYVDLLFQLSKEEVQKQASLFDTKQVDRTVIETYLFFAIELSHDEYSRTELSVITREVNRLFPMPAMILFKHGKIITLSAINRRLHKRDESKDVLEKVTLIKDIVIENPHRAHIEILFDISFDELRSKHQFTNFVELHNAWQKTLDTKELNKTFFIDLVDWYFWASDKVQFPDDIEKNKDIRNATNLIRLITRVIFIWFIKEKSLVPNNLFNKAYLEKILKDFNKNVISSNYYQAILQNLFFGTLNQKMNERNFTKEGDININKKEYGVKNLFRYADLFNISENDVLQLFKDVPFLNGGLFDCLDKENEDGKIIYVDGFSRNPKKQAIVPDYLFFGNDKVDLTQYYDPQAKKPIIKEVMGLINILDKYKFTVEENTPIEEEIALDPELLGKVFENLLASYNPETQTTARKQTGSFYTPREIVNYMVDESLIEYLKQKVDSKAYDFDNRLKDLVTYNHNSNPLNSTETNAVIEAINNAKILDPACGSGAFPMGVLHKMVHLLQKLDPNNTKWKAQQREKIIGTQIKELEKDKIAIQGLNDKAVREKAEKAVQERLIEIDEIFESKNNFDDYARKLYLIENCIYGIDIQPIAVQISKLRFFISLIIHQNKDSQKENLGLRSLPNLETKFVAANTLIGLEIPTTDLFSENNPIKILQDELKTTRHEYFNAKNRKDKLSLQKKDKKLRKKIALKINELLVKKSEDELIDIQKRILIENGKLAIIHSEPENIEVSETTNLFGETVQTKIDKKKEKLKAQKDLISLLEKQLKTLKTADNKEAILKAADQISSFDPYDQNHFANWFEPEWMFGNDVKDGFDVVIGNPPYVNVFNIVDEKFRNYLKINYFVSKNKSDLYAFFIEKGNKLLKQKGILSYIVSNSWLGTESFMNLRKYLLTNTKVNYLVECHSNVFEAAVTPVIISFSNEKISQHEVSLLKLFDNNFIKLSHSLSYNRISLLKNYSFSFQDDIKIIINTIPLGQIVSFGLGIKTSDNDRFVLDYKKDNNSYKVLRGKDIDSYSINWSNLWIWYKPTLMMEKNGAGPRKKEYFIQEKLLIRDVDNKITAVFDNNDFLVLDTINLIFKTENSFELKYILSLLNSRFINKWFKVNFPAGLHIKNNQLKQIPIANISSINQQPFIAIVDQILSAKAANSKSDTSQLERQIDEMVYKLYKLTDEEIAIIEGGSDGK